MSDAQGKERALDPVEVCDLSPADLRARIRWIRGELLPHVAGRVRLAKGVALELRAAPDVEAKLDHWIELERSCCGPLTWTRTASSHPSRLRVEIGGVDPDGPLFAGLPLLEAEDESTARPR